MVVENFLDNKAEKALRKYWVQLRLTGESPQARNLKVFPGEVRRGQLVGSFQLPNSVRQLEPFRQNENERGIQIVDAGPQGHELGWDQVIAGHCFGSSTVLIIPGIAPSPSIAARLLWNGLFQQKILQDLPAFFDSLGSNQNKALLLEKWPGRFARLCMDALYALRVCLRFNPCKKTGRYSNTLKFRVNEHHIQQTTIGKVGEAHRLIVNYRDPCRSTESGCAPRVQIIDFRPSCDLLRGVISRRYFLDCSQKNVDRRMQIVAIVGPDCYSQDAFLRALGRELSGCKISSGRWLVRSFQLLSEPLCIALPHESGRTRSAAEALLNLTHGINAPARAICCSFISSGNIEGSLLVPNPHEFHTPQASYSKSDLFESGRGGYFGPGNAQLPSPPMLMMDRIVEISMDGGDYGNGHVAAELDITRDLWFFECHFVNDPVMPGCLGLDAMWQIVGYWLGWSGAPGKGRAIGVGEVRFSGDITPLTKLVRYEVSIKRARRGALTLGQADGKVLADGKAIYSAKDLRVGMIKPAA